MFDDSSMPAIATGGDHLAQMELTYESQIRWRERVAAGIRFGVWGTSRSRSSTKSGASSGTFAHARPTTSCLRLHPREVDSDPQAWRAIIRAAEPWVQES